MAGAVCSEPIQEVRIEGGGDMNGKLAAVLGTDHRGMMYWSKVGKHCFGPVDPAVMAAGKPQDVVRVRILA